MAIPVEPRDTEEGVGSTKYVKYLQPSSYHVKKGTLGADGVRRMRKDRTVRASASWDPGCDIVGANAS